MKKGFVKEVHEDRIKVQVCKKNSRSMEEIYIETKKKFEVGDFVCFEMSDSLIPDTLVLTYSLPIILFFSGYFISEFFGLPEGMKIVISLLATVACSIAIKAFDALGGRNFSYKNISAE